MTENVKHVEVLSGLFAIANANARDMSDGPVRDRERERSEALAAAIKWADQLQREAAGDGEGVPYWVNALPAPIGNPQDWPENFANGFNEALRRVDEALPAKWRLDAPRTHGVRCEPPQAQPAHARRTHCAAIESRQGRAQGIALEQGTQLRQLSRGPVLSPLPLHSSPEEGTAMSNVSLRITLRDGDQVRSIDVDTFPAAPPVLELVKPGERVAGSTQRFTDNGEGTVTDAKTGLTWTKDDVTDKAVKHAAAEQACKDCRVAGFEDWELPTREQLLTLIDDTRHDPAIDKSAFPSCKSEWYWTSTPCAWSPSDCAWGVSFGGGGSNYGVRGSGSRVRAVRRASRQ